MPSRTAALAAAIALLICPAPGLAHASQSPQSAPSISVPRLVNISGTFRPADGQKPAHVEVVTLAVYADETGGEPLWQETQSIAVDPSGAYTVLLGATEAGGVPLDVFASGQARWLSMTWSRAGEVEGSRTRLTSVPYALRAADADTLGGTPLSAFVVTGADGRLQRADGATVVGPAADGTGVAGQIAKWTSESTLGSSVISESTTNRVGFGLTDPTGGGVVDSVFTIRNFDNNTGFGILNETQQRRFAINTLATGGWLLYDGGNTTWNPGIFQRVGRVGVGTTNPTAKLHAVDTTGGYAITGEATTFGTGVSGTSSGGIGVIGTSSHFVGLYGVATNNAIENYGVVGVTESPTGFAGYFIGRGFFNGDVGIGTDSPLDKLHVTGDIRVGTGATGCVKDADGTTIAGVCASDLRFKKNITPFASTVGKLSQLQAVRFDWRADEFPDKHFGAARSFGLIAQDVEVILPELVVTDEQGFKAIKYNELPLHMLQAIKELKAENDVLKQQLQQQQMQFSERLRRLEQLVVK